MMKEAKTANYWVCQNCILPIETGDFSEINHYYCGPVRQRTIQAIQEGMHNLANNHENGILTSNFTRETKDFSTEPCDCCKNDRAGVRYKVIVIHD